MASLRLTALAAVNVAALLLAACAASIAPAQDADRLPGETAIADLQPTSLGPGERLQVVATTTVAADVVHVVAGEDADVGSLLPLGTDPHAFELGPGDIRLLVEADVVFINGLGLEEFLDDPLREAGASGVIVSLSEGLTPLRMVAAEGGGEEDHNEGDHHHAGGTDPHVWLDPLNVSRWAENAGAALAALDPLHAEEYRARASAYAAELTELDAWIKEQVETIAARDRLLVTDHDELGYFAARYGFEIIGLVIPAYSTAAEPSAQEIAALERAIREHDVRAIFVSAAANPRLADRVAQDTGARLVVLYTASLTDAAGPAPSYPDLMRYNVSQIVDALRP